MIDPAILRPTFDVKIKIERSTLKQPDIFQHITPTRRCTRTTRRARFAHRDRQRDDPAVVERCTRRPRRTASWKSPRQR